MSLLSVLEERGFLSDCTNRVAVEELLKSGEQSIYCGFDPTANSLTIGNMVCLMALRHIQESGHKPIILMGGATGMIGDPSGKSKERNLQTTEMVASNMAGQRGQFLKFLRFEGPHAAEIVNNNDWCGTITMIDFLRDVGKFFRIGEMLGKESVRNRIQSEVGISYTEFSYMLLQSYDFLHLYKTRKCRLQCGGSDQWGNIVAGTELIRKSLGEDAFGFTFPLITTANGEKLGKTAEGAVWLSEEKTTPYEFYQYWVRADDRDVDRYLKLFTLLPVEKIRAIVEEHQRAPESRSGQKALAEEVTTLVHGAEEARKAREAATALFSDSLSNLSDEKLLELFPDVPSVSASREVLESAEGFPLLDLVMQAGFATSKGEARKLVASSGVYLNNQAIAAEKRSLVPSDLASPSMAILRAGKKRYCIVKFE
ncbi:MAG: tyrosine--tRNA ligase [Candidatus Sumerlaeia bacterium]|nr:tyrosine--tRNA ligase [Candidatus Sumerlaeia bacterium]